MKTMLANFKEVEAKKRVLEEAVDTLNENLAKKTANGKNFYNLDVEKQSFSCVSPLWS